MEGVAAIAVVFVLFTVLTQAATALIAHRAGQSAVAASAARVAIAPDSAGIETDRLERTVEAIVPGARGAEVRIVVGSRLVTATVGFVFLPPGPVLRAFEMEVSADVPVVVEP